MKILKPCWQKRVKLLDIKDISPCDEILNWKKKRILLIFWHYYMCKKNYLDKKEKKHQLSSIRHLGHQNPFCSHPNLYKNLQIRLFYAVLPKKIDNSTTYQ